jgi:hypothetical protein
MLPGGRVAQAKQGFGDLGAPGTDQTVKANHFPGANPETDILVERTAGKTLHLEGHVAKFVVAGVAASGQACARSSTG